MKKLVSFSLEFPCKTCHRVNKIYVNKITHFLNLQKQKTIR